MRINFELGSIVSRVAITILVSAGAVAYFSLAAGEFVLSVVTEPEVQAETSVIEGTAGYFPNSALAQARMASHLIESHLDLSLNHEVAAERAVYYSARAVKLEPRNYEFRMLLAAAHELSGDAAEAETELRAAARLAPNQVRVHWRLANLLLREDKLEEAVPEFRLANEGDPELLTPSLNLLWQAAGGKIETLTAVVANDPGSQVGLARFLVQQGEYETAVKIARRIDHESLLNLPGGGQLLESLISAGQFDLAGGLWRELFGAEGRNELIWNGGFETPPRGNFTQFDWMLGESKYARIGIAKGNARTGEHSLRLSYQGLDTTALRREIYQLVAVRPGAQYTLRCYVKAEKLATPGGPQVVVTTPDFQTAIAASATVEAGTYQDWRLLTTDFVAPADARALLISIRQTPQFSYVEPTRGTLWFDDFSLLEK